MSLFDFTGHQAVIDKLVESSMQTHELVKRQQQAIVDLHKRLGLLERVVIALQRRGDG